MNKIHGWNITQTNGYFKAFKRINGKLIGVHLGKEDGGNWGLKVRRKEQLIRIERGVPLVRARQFKGIVFKSAPKRNSDTLSTPMEWLVNNREKGKHGLLVGKLLDYGCGYGTDADIVKMDKYDPNFFPHYPTERYDTITCSYVLNILERHQIKSTLNKIKNLLEPTGNAYITVSNITNTEHTDYGVIYRPVVLYLPIITYKSGHFTMYHLTKYSNIKVSLLSV